MSAARSYAAVIVDDRRAHRPPDTPPPRREPDESATAGAAAPDSGEPAAGESIDLSSLSIAGFTRRRVGWACAALVAAWIVVIFARQAGDGAAAAARADQIARDNAALANEVAALEHELQVIERPQYVAQQARGYRPRHRQGDPVHARPVGPDAGSGRAGIGLDPRRRGRRARDAARVVALAVVRSGRLAGSAALGRQASGRARVDRCRRSRQPHDLAARPRDPAGTARGDGAATSPAVWRPMIAGTSSGRTGRAKK